MNKQEYVFILQGDMTPFQRATIAKWIHNKACQLNIGYACNYHGDGGDGEITYSQMMDKKNHPLTEEEILRQIYLGRKTLSYLDEDCEPIENGKD
tara:strand:+ start:143 stop:427 length:285 start_codon:yes stop_codon:yes gene_type:complete